MEAFTDARRGEIQDRLNGCVDPILKHDILCLLAHIDFLTSQNDKLEKIVHEYDRSCLKW